MNLVNVFCTSTLSYIANFYSLLNELAKLCRREIARSVIAFNAFSQDLLWANQDNFGFPVQVKEPGAWSNARRLQSIQTLVNTGRLNVKEFNQFNKDHPNFPFRDIDPEAVSFSPKASIRYKQTTSFQFDWEAKMSKVVENPKWQLTFTN